jgi:hypothetical protein
VTPNQEKCLFKVTKCESCVTGPNFLVWKNCLFDDQVKGPVRHSGRFFSISLGILCGCIERSVSQLLVKLELKDLKTGFHSAPGFSLSGH